MLIMNLQKIKNDLLNIFRAPADTEIETGFPGGAFGLSEFGRFVLLAILGVVASRLNINIPYTDAYIEGRWIFGYMGAVLLPHWWAVVLLACILSVAYFRELSVWFVLTANMMYALPTIVIIRTVHNRWLARVRNNIWYAVGWCGVVMLCYQLFVTPIVWGALAIVEEVPILPQVVQSWRDQPYFIESLLVGIISALAMTVIRSDAALRASRHELATTLYAIGDGVIATDTRGRVQRLNSAAEYLTGWTEAAARGQPLENVFHIINEETRAPVPNPVARVLAEGIVVGLANHTLLVARDGTERPILDSGAPIRDGEGHISGVVLVFRDQTAERAAQQQLQESNARLLLALHHARMGIWEGNLETGQVTWAGEHAALFGIPLAKFGGTIDDVLAHIHANDRAAVQQTWQRLGEEQPDFDLTYRVVWGDGSIHWLHSYGRLTTAPSGVPRRIVGVTQDITARKEAETRIRRALAEKEMLLRELYHRTNNNMQVIRAMLGLQAAQSPHPAVHKLVAETEQRIQAMALVHRQLYQAQDLSHLILADYLTELTQLLRDSYAPSTAPLTLNLDLEPVAVLIDTAIPCGLVLTELLSNTLQHAFPDGRGGEVQLRLRRVSETELELSYADNGVGVPPDIDLTAPQTLGLQTVVALVEHQLQGTVAFGGPPGFTCHIRFMTDLYTPRV